MDAAIQYQNILAQYPHYMTKDQMYRICHISKKTCLFLLESGLVPCLDSGKKTHRFKIKTTDVIKYLEDRDTRPEYYKAPSGYYTKLCSPPPRALSDNDLSVMKQYYEKELAICPDVMTINQVSAFTGYGKTSVERWCSKGYLQHLFVKQRYLVPKIYLLDFLLSWHYIGIGVKSKLDIQRNKQIFSQAKNSL